MTTTIECSKLIRKILKIKVNVLKISLSGIMIHCVIIVTCITVLDLYIYVGVCVIKLQMFSCLGVDQGQCDGISGCCGVLQS